MKKPADDIVEFLRESNAIEDVRDEESLRCAMLAWKYIMRMSRLDVSVILRTHKILMANQPLPPEQKGSFRKVPVYIGGREGIAWPLIPSSIEQTLQWMNDTLHIKYKNKDADELSRMFHINYEVIHPFVDGNGRTGRMFMNWWRVRRGMKIKIIWNAKKSEYYKWFE